MLRIDGPIARQWVDGRTAFTSFPGLYLTTPAMATGSQPIPTEPEEPTEQPLPDGHGSEGTRNRTVTVRERFPTVVEIEEVGQVELPQPDPGFLGDYYLVFECSRQDTPQVLYPMTSLSKNQTVCYPSHQ